MPFIFDLDPYDVPFLVIGAGFLALAAWLVVLDFPSRLNRALALYLFLGGTPEILRAVSFSTPEGFALRALGIVMTATAPFALVYFILAFAEQFGGARRWRRRSLLPLVVLAAALAALVAGGVAQMHTNGMAIPGAYRFVPWLQVLAPSLAALYFARKATRPGLAQRRRALFLASLAFAVGPLTGALHMFIPGLMDADPVAKVTYAISLVPFGLLALHVTRVAATTPDRALAAEARRFLFVLGLPVASVLLLAVAAAVWADLAPLLMVVLMGVWILALPVLATYSLVRHRLFDIDVKLRWGISKSTIAAVFVAVFFVASEAAQQFFGETLGSTYVGIAAAGALVFAFAPLQRLAERLAERAVPVATPASHSASMVEETYRSAVARLLSDGALSRDDERLLARLATDLGIDARLAFEAREAVEAELAAKRDAARVEVGE